MKQWIKWEQVEEYINEVFDYYKDKNITGVYGLPRGGLVLAVMLSHKLNIPLLMAPINNCIIVDDICDSGESLLHYVTNKYDNNKYHITTMYYKRNNLVEPEFYLYYKDDEWIVYPWEVD